MEEQEVRAPCQFRDSLAEQQDGNLRTHSKFEKRIEDSVIFWGVSGNKPYYSVVPNFSFTLRSGRVQMEYIQRNSKRKGSENRIRKEDRLDGAF